jgi:hypothetical protein
MVPIDVQHHNRKHTNVLMSLHLLTIFPTTNSKREKGHLYE